MARSKMECANGSDSAIWQVIVNDYITWLTSTALHEIVTPDTRILIPRGFGSHSNYNSIRIYSRELRRMITLSFKNGSGMPEDDVTYFLRSVQLRKPTDDRATMKRTN